MADLYNSSAYRPSSASSTKDDHHQPSYPPSTNSLVYGLPATPSLPSSSASPLDMDHRDQDPSKPSQSSEPPKMESKPQATFLTKLYALLERPEYQSMIRWDANGEQIIVERPEQLALHVLPSIYRQSRFASFSRQLNIYGFMRKVNLRNVDPAIDDPDASTWSHPTLTRNSPPEVVANFKRRVPPRLPKQRKRSEAGTELPRLDIPPHQALPPHHHVPSSHHQQLGGGIGLPTLPLNMGVPNDMKNRPRGLSAPGPYGMPPMGTMGGGMTPIQTPQSATFPSTGSKWGNGMQGGPPPSSYGRNALPPIAIPGSGSYGGGGGPQSAYSQLSGISPHDDGSYGPASAASGYGNHHSQSSSTIPGLRDHNSVFAYNSYGGPNEGPTSASSTSGPGWANSYGLPPASSLTGGGSPSHGPSSGSLSSILNPSAGSSSSGYPQRPSLTTATSFPSSYSSHAPHNANSLSPDSRPTTGYSVAPYDLDSATTAPDSARPLTPGSLHRPSSAKSLVGPSSAASQLSLRHGRPRRRSEAVGQPYPQPYYDGHGSINTDLRPVTAPSAGSDNGSLKGLHLPSVSVMDSWSGGQNSTTTGGAGDFAYSPTTQHPEGASDAWTRGLRPSTSTSSISAASTSMIHTPPIMEEHEGETNGNGAGGPGRSHSISTPGSNDAGLDGDISRYATDFFPLSSTLNSHHGSASPDHLNASSSSYRPISPLDGLKVPGFGQDLKPSDIDFGDPLRDAAL
ncbi:hypothetical protein FRC04_005796 [Tulasnella sp. 424]|nr:hypothetical protein FRC04_005796 [Tulasnella sp. 424]KAG8971355.1 hypothetical protein FRC05_011117 [Tulasnella sp. 425]